MNRTIQPQVNPIDHVDFVKPSVFDIASNTKLFCMSKVPNETARFDLYFDAGTIRGKAGLAALVNGLLLSGTKDKSSIVINEEINALGGYLELGISNENAVLSMYALRENLVKIARIVQDAIQNCVFDSKEVEQLIAERKQKFTVSMEKVSVLAQRALKQRLFSNSEAYGTVAQLTDFDTISQDDIRLFHEQYYLQGLNRVVVVGNFNQDDVDAFIDIFGNWSQKIVPEFEENFVNLKGHSHIEKDGAVQTAIRLARALFNKTHEDYLEFLVLNTIIGDYFGSRLMTNIREDKGYTYGIGSMVAEMNQTGYFLIATEVGKNVKDATLKEIRFELERLQTELIGDDELELVKNYMLGQLLKSADGPYSMTDLFLSVEIHNLGLDFYNKAIEVINSITPNRIQELAKKYLDWNDFTIISAG